MSRIQINNGAELIGTVEHDPNDDTLKIEAHGGRKVKAVGTIIDEQGRELSNQPPIGAAYIQFPGLVDPETLWPGTDWTLVDFGGAFFRAEGGNAGAFGGGQQGDAIRQIYGYFEANGWGDVESYSQYGALYYYDQGRYDADQSSTKRSVGLKFAASRYVPTAAENRPINVTIRVWRRDL